MRVACYEFFPEAAKARLQAHFEVDFFAQDEAGRIVFADHPSPVFVDPPHQALALSLGLKTRVDARFIAQFPHLKFISSFGVGYDHIDVEAARDAGIMVSHTPDVLNDEVADTAIALLLATIRHLPQADRFVREGRWLNAPFPLSPSLTGRKIGLIGMGRIGQVIAKRLSGFEVKLAYHNRREVEGCPLPYYPDLLSLAREVDGLISILPKTPETYQIINQPVFEALGKDGVFINIGRGWSVDEAALIAALHHGTISCAGLDVFQTEPAIHEDLYHAPNLVLLPHIGSASRPTRLAMANIVIDNLIAWEEEGRARTPIPEMAR